MATSSIANRLVLNQKINILGRSSSSDIANKDKFKAFESQIALKTQQLCPKNYNLVLRGYYRSNYDPRNIAGFVKATLVKGIKVSKSTDNF